MKVCNFKGLIDQRIKMFVWTVHMLRALKKKNCTYFKEKKSDPFSIGMNFFVLFSGVSFFLVYCNQLR